MDHSRQILTNGLSWIKLLAPVMVQSPFPLRLPTTLQGQVPASGYRQFRKNLFLF